MFATEYDTPHTPKMLTDLFTWIVTVAMFSRIVTADVYSSITGDGSTSKLTVADVPSRLRRRRALPATTSTILMRFTSMPKVKARLDMKESFTL